MFFQRKENSRDLTGSDFEFLIEQFTGTYVYVVIVRSFKKLWFLSKHVLYPHIVRNQVHFTGVG